MGIVFLFSAGGILFLISSFYINDLLQGSVVNIAIFLFTLTTTQAIADVAVDAWSLALLSDYDPSLRTIDEISGIRIGQLISKTIFILLESPDFCNKRIRPLLGLPEDKTQGV